MRQISKKMKLTIFLVILIIVVGTACFYFSKVSRIHRNQLLPMAKVEEKSNNVNLNNTENLATSSSESKIILGEHYYKDNGDIYFDDKNGAGSWKVDNVDPSSFKVIDEQSEYSTDKNNVYYRGLILTKADTKTFKKLEGEKCSSAYADYYVDKNNIYYYNEVLSSDPASFSCLGDGWAKDKNDYYFAGALASFNYQDKMIYFENIADSSQNKSMGAIDTNVYILDKKTKDKKKIFSFGRVNPGADGLVKIAPTNYSNIIQFANVFGDSCGFYEEYWYYDISNNKILETKFRGGCAFGSNLITVDNIEIDNLIDSQGCGDVCQDSCQNLKPILRDIIVNKVPQKIFKEKEVLNCDLFDSWGPNVDLNYVGVNKDFSKVYFTLSIGKWDKEKKDNIILKEYKLSYDVSEKKVVVVNEFLDQLLSF